MATLRELKARIGSVASSEKITGAMKMISSAKMHKAEQALRQLRPFRSQIEIIIENLLSADTPFTAPLLEARDVHSVALVVWGSDDGLCGAYNVNVFKQLIATIDNIRASHPGVKITIIPVGAKIAKQAIKLVGGDVTVETIPGLDSKSSEETVKSFTKTLSEGFLSGKYDSVEALSTHFHSVSRQRIESRRLLPVDRASLSATTTADSAKNVIKPYIFEPGPQAIFDAILPLFQQAVMQDLFTQNTASEQAARVMAMQSANDNAKKLLEQLRLEYNKLRQQSITSELLDIVGGQVR